MPGLLPLLPLFVSFASPSVPANPQGPNAVEAQRPARERIAVEGTSVELLLWREDSAAEPESSWYRISLDGMSWSRARRCRGEIELVWGRFDPLQAPPDVQEAPLPAVGNLHVVQFVTQSLAAFRETLTEMGAEVSRPLPNHAHVVRMDAETREAVEALPWVRWVGLYHPVYRLDPEVALELGAGTLGSGRYRIQVLKRGPEQKELVAGRLLEVGGVIEAQIPDGFILEATLDEQQLAQVVTWDEVLYVDRWSAPEADMDLVRADGGANYMTATFGYTGQGVRGECCDGNVVATHPDLQSNPVIFHGTHDGSASHGTPVTGVVFGDGTANSNATGLMPSGQPIFADYSHLSNRYTHTAELLQSPYLCAFQTCSWGSTRTTVYNSYSFEMDDILFLNDVLITQSQSNAGDQDSRPQAWAKNVVAVGAVRHQNTLGTGDDSWSGSASIGPAADGRIKPDLHYWYDSIYTLDEVGYSNFCCTSAATPCVAGHFGLFYQMWHEGVFTGHGGGASVFESRPKATTARALMINNAWSYPFSGTNHDLTRVHQGWGRPDLERMEQWADRTFIVDEEEVLGNLETAGYPLTVAAGETEFRATMVYLDPAGTTSASLHRINDLSLRVTSPGGQVYWGNNGLNAGNLSTIGGSSNTKDVVENVFVANPAPGVWLVDVIADAIIQDSHTETGALDADFALVVSGVDNQPCDGPEVYCQTSPNSVGSGAQMTWLGFPSLQADDFHLAAIDGPADQFIMFYYGGGQTQTVFGNGWRCVNAGGVGIYRFKPFLIDVVGIAVMKVDYTQPPAGGSGLGAWVVGDTWYCQGWYRDPAAGGAQFNLTDGLEIHVCP